MRALPDYRGRGEEAELGVSGARHNQFSPAQRVIGGRGEEGDPGDDSNHYQDGWKGSRRMLGPALAETFITPDLLAEEGIRYLCDWCNDDQPYPMKIKKGKLISVPYSVEINEF